MKQVNTIRSSWEASHAAERVLVIGGEVDMAPLGRELTRRGADVSIIEDIARASQALQRQPLDIVIVAARPDADATALLIALARAHTGGKATILLLVDLARAESYGGPSSRPMKSSANRLRRSASPTPRASGSGARLDQLTPHVVRRDDGQAALDRAVDVAALPLRRESLRRLGGLLDHLHDRLLRLRRDLQRAS